MPLPDADLQQNAEATRRLRALVDRLSADDLRRSLGGGWTVAVALVHVGFWDGVQAASLRAFIEGHPYPSDDAEASTNVALDPIARLLDPAVAADVVMSAAEDIDAVIAGLTAEQRAALIDSGHAYAVRRFGHREEHIAQIEAVLG